MSEVNSVMRLSDVPAIQSLTGSESVFVNDGGSVKQVAVPQMRGGKYIFEIPETVGNEGFTDLVIAIENGKEIWLATDGEVSKVLNWDWMVTCGPSTYISASYATVSGGLTNVSSTLVGKILYSTSDTALLDRFITAVTTNT